MQDIFSTGYSIYQVVWFFFIYSFIGWCIEVVFKSITRGHFINSGFLNSPLCPIYGFGSVSVILILHPIQNNIFLLFIGAVLLTTILELITGYLMNVAFHTRWWDYSKEKFNIGGYICPQFSIAWGLGCIFLIKVLQPLIKALVNLIPNSIGIIVLIIFSLITILDVVATTLAINHMNKELAKANEFTKKIHNTSDALAKEIGNKAIEVSVKIQDLKERKEQEKLEDNSNKKLKNNREKIINNLADKNAYIRKRLIKAFPSMKNKKYNEELNDVKEKINNNSK